FYPVFKQKRAMDAMQLLMRFGACAAIPIKINNVVMGAFFVVSKKKEFSKPEILLLQLFANFYGMAKTNFNNIESLRKLYETEKETAAILTHELKTPIAIAYNSSAILGQTIEKYGSALKTEFVDKLKTQQLEIQESIIRMNMICNSIFSLTEVENNLSVENQKLDLSNSIGRMVYTYKNFTKKEVAFSYKEKIKKGVYYGPAIQFGQVISIVLENAFKYTKKGYVKMFLNMTGKVMECTITDSGPGISKNEREKIFERFYRSDSTIKVGKGLGLGLYIATKIAAKLGGKIDLMDNPDQRGSRFVIRFPVYTKSNK
ncbi:GAF domain-containing sensor histidine kinase, partial [Candidatus Peregrinibacteria bacterium]|nr:GAF domain-containing sensor histidine kinase [Candidatus Peregrinibacteria bacterium]